MSAVRWKSTIVSGRLPTWPVYWRGLGRRTGRPAPSRKRRVSSSNSPLLETPRRSTSPLADILTALPGYGAAKTPRAPRGRQDDDQDGVPESSALFLSSLIPWRALGALGVLAARPRLPPAGAAPGQFGQRQALLGAGGHCAPGDDARRALLLAEDGDVRDARAVGVAQVGGDAPAAHVELDTPT